VVSELALGLESGSQWVWSRCRRRSWFYSGVIIDDRYGRNRRPLNI